MKRKKPKLVALGIKPVRAAEKNIRHLWRADVEASSGGGGAEQVHIHLAGNGFLYRCVGIVKRRAGMLAEWRTKLQEFSQASILLRCFGRCSPVWMH
jgi:hypothetical protein